MMRVEETIRNLRDDKGGYIRSEVFKLIVITLINKENDIDM